MAIKDSHVLYNFSIPSIFGSHLLEREVNIKSGVRTLCKYKRLLHGHRHKLNSHKASIKSLLDVLLTFNLRPASRGVA